MSDALSIIVEEGDDGIQIDPESGSIISRGDDGGAVVRLDPRRRREQQPDDFYENLASHIDDGKLAQIAEELIDAIEADKRSREGSLAIVAKALDYLGIELKEPKSVVGDSAAPVEGMSSVTNPLLLEACLKGWANTVGELLPSDGPVKIRDEGELDKPRDDLAEALERDMNHYLTVTASEYYPDTSHMILWGPYFRGSGFKKIYRCPMRRRPVSESVSAENFIVSDATKDLRTCARITHQIEMRPSVMKRMMFLGAYRDVALTQPMPQPNQVEQKISGIQGFIPSARPEDQPYTLYESQCELDLEEGFDHPSMRGNKLNGEGIPLPYIVTLDKDSRQILAIRRDWREGDQECERRRLYVKYPYVPGPGFLGTGLLHILGNCTAALTAAWREALDAGMFASFPGFLIDKAAVRQNTADMRCAPGQGVPIETSQRPIGQIAMPLPYRDPSAGLMSLIDKILNQANGLGGAADIPAAEGIANVPVGTMLAQIEQATKVMSAAHKGMHAAQAEEFQCLLELFREHPEDFWRFNKVAPDFWDEQKLLQALDDYNLVPVSDPNVPSHLHRVMKAMGLLQLAGNPIIGPYFSGKEIAVRCLRALKEDENGLLVDPPPQQMPAGDPADMLKAQASMMSAQAAQTKAQTAAAQAQTEAQLQPAKIQTERDIQTTELAKEMIIHQGDQDRLAREQQIAAGNQRLDAQRFAHDRAMDVARHVAERAAAARDHSLAVGGHVLDQQQAAHDAALGVAQHQHDRQMDIAQHRLDVHQALHPPKPASTSKPKGKS